MTQLDRVREAIARAKLGALLLMDDKNIYYACGFMPTDSAALITPERAWLITDSRYIEDAQRKCVKGVEVLPNSVQQPMWQTLKRLAESIAREAKRKQRTKEIEQRLEALEAEEAALNEELAARTADYTAVKEITGKLEALRSESDALYEEYETLI